MIVVLPVKRFAEAKQRLGDNGLRARLAPAMVEDVMRSLRGLDVIVVSGEDAIRPLATELGFEVVEDPDQGHSEAAARGVRRALQRGAQSVALVPGDCPLLDPADLLSAPGLRVFADRHGDGTNGLIIGPPDAITPAFGPGSRARHQQLARAAGLPCTVVEDSSLTLDADTAQDIELLRAALREAPQRAPRTAEVLL